MPILKSAQKALRQSTKRRAINLRKRKSLGGAIKTFKKFAAEKKMEDARRQLSLVFKLFDKAVKTHLIHKNTAARKKSRLARLLQPKKK